MARATTIVQACRQQGINPFDYLKDVLTQIPGHSNKTVAQLTPENWLKNRQIPAARAALQFERAESGVERALFEAIGGAVAGGDTLVGSSSI
jgi:hypothetical protein